MQKKLVLNSSVFLWHNNNDGLLYDWTTATNLKFSVLDPDIRSLCHQWDDIGNLYSASFDSLNNRTAFRSFVQSIIELGFGSVYDIEAPVVSLPPVLKINRGVEMMDQWQGGIDSQPLLPYLINLRLFLGGTADGRDWWKQVHYPMASIERLQASRVLRFLQRCDLRSLTHIDLVVGEWNHDQIETFVEGIASINLMEKTRLFFTHQDPAFHNDILDRLKSDGIAVTQVCPPDTELSVTDWVQGRKYHLLLRNEAEYNHWESIICTDGSISYEFKPVADGNLPFFQSMVFLSEDEILGQKLSKKGIFRHQALNVNQFGTLYVFPDGTIHPATDAPVIGTLEDSVHQIIIRELKENHAWRQTRRLIEPCKDCIYHDLCPSPSVYEKILGSPACTVKHPEA